MQRERFVRGVRIAAYAAAAAAFLFAFPTPYYLISPGNAVDLSRAIFVDGHAPPPDRYYLTDVTLQRAAPLALLEAILPGNRLIPAAELIPAGVEPVEYQSIMVDSMTESQSVAAVVAERAAGLHVENPHSRVYVRNFAASDPPARKFLTRGDIIAAVNGVPIETTGQITNVVSKLRPGDLATVDILRAGKPLHLRIPTIATTSGTRIGIILVPRFLRPQLAVPVRFDIPDVSGSSGGLMFALDIYASLRGARGSVSRQIAGTGTLAYDGTVGPIEGTVQKLIAAKRAGARIFLVPLKNYNDVRGERDVRIVPVGTFSEALAAISS